MRQLALFGLFMIPVFLWSQQTITVDLLNYYQEIDGFGAHQGNEETNQSWWQELYYDDLGATMYRVDLTPRLVSPYSDLSYYSPWFMGSQTKSVFNLEDLDNPNGPEGNRVRTYTGPEDYGREFGGENAPIAVMGPDIEENILQFTFPNDGAIQAGIDRKEQLGDFKLIGSLWSPVPWVKVSSGNSWSQGWWPGPVFGSPWPFIWGGNFGGGMLDVSGQLYEEFDDTTLGGTGPTSALTQFARSTAAYVLGYQRTYNTTFYAISIQNELNFEQFYNSATYPLSSQYITALKAIRAEFDKYPELAGIRLMGPEDLLGGDAYGMYEYGGPVHKNLQYLKHLSNDPEAMAALELFCIHGYGSDGVSSSGADSQLWDWWVNGWTDSPAPGIPGDVAGFSSFDKKSWMTETSGEERQWLWPSTGYPSNGGWSIAVKIHQALTTGQESAWLYWTFTETDDNGNVTPYALSSQSAGNTSPKYVAAKHFFKFIPPGSIRVEAKVNSEPALLASAYYHQNTDRLTLVVVNTSSETIYTHLGFVGAKSPYELNFYRSDKDSLWRESIYLQTGNWPLLTTIPGYGVVTITGTGLYTTAVSDPEWNEASDIKVSPNPNRGAFDVQFHVQQPGDALFRLIDTQGQIIIERNEGLKGAGNQIIHFEANYLPAGTYTCEVQVGHQIWKSRVILVD